MLSGAAGEDRMKRGWGLAAALESAIAVAAIAGTPQYVGVGKWKPCHLPEFGTWSASAHAGALETAKAADTFSADCLKCHTTNASESMPGVQCEACHGPGSEYWPIPVMYDLKKAVQVGLLVQDQKLCDGCHDGLDHHAKVVFGTFKHDHREKKEAVELE
jgi:hypothetical protein